MPLHLLIAFHESSLIEGKSLKWRVGEGLVWYSMEESSRKLQIDEDWLVIEWRSPVKFGGRIRFLLNREIRKGK